jgi:signal transduction histidine kinase
MIPAAIPSFESERLQELYRMSVLDTQPDEDFNEIVEVASRICKVPISLITLVDTNRQWFKAKKGLDVDETDRNSAFCTHTILGDGIMQVKDAELDERFAGNPFVVENPHIRFYAGIPLVTSKGYNLGSLCVIDTVPRSLNEDQIFTLSILSKQVIKLFELRLKNLEIEAKNAIVESQKKHLQELSEIQNKIISIVAHDVRSPVASLKNMLDLKKSGDISPEEMDEFIVTIGKQMDHTLNLLTNLVEWGSILMKKSSAKLKFLNLNKLVDSEFKKMDITSAAKQNILINEIPEEYLVNTDENMLLFILRNLLINAIKFTESGSITISATISGNKVKVMVADTGIGMNDDVKNNLFGINRKSSHKGTNMEEGSGLGLILAQEFTEKLGSSLTVESKVNKGTSISFDLQKANLMIA